jgi:hypothetical protein
MDNLDIDTFGLTVMLEESKYYLDLQYTNVDSIKATGRTIFGSSSLILSLIGTFQLIIGLSSPISLFILIITLILYIILVAIALQSILPISLKSPAEITIKNLTESYYQESKSTILSNRFYSYVSAVEQNEIIISKLTKNTQVTAYLLITIIFLLTLSFLITALFR